MFSNKSMFACDNMLGRLAKWLRLFGYDTYYNKNLSFGELLFTAIKEKRVVFTRRHRFPSLSNVNIFKISSEILEKQIEELVEHFGIKTSVKFSRCSICNNPLIKIEKEFVKSYVPTYTYITHNKFYKCNKCDKIYWKGTHLNRAEEFLKSQIKTGD